MLDEDSSTFTSFKASFELRSNFAPIRGVVVTSYVNCRVRPGSSFLKPGAAVDQEELSAMVRLLPHGSFGGDDKIDAIDAREGM